MNRHYEANGYFFAILQTHLKIPYCVSVVVIFEFYKVFIFITFKSNFKFIR
jgi:hypothetical protein